MQNIVSMAGVSVSLDRVETYRGWDMQTDIPMHIELVLVCSLTLNKNSIIR